MKIDAVYSLPETVVGAQLGEATVCLARQLLDAARTYRDTGLVETTLVALGTKGSDNGFQDFIRAECVVILQRRRLIGHLVSHSRMGQLTAPAAPRRFLGRPFFRALDQLNW